MKKVLLFSAVALGSIFTSAQVISNDDFSSTNFTAGRISNAVYPAVGQGGWQVAVASTNLDDFKIETLNGRQVASVISASAATGGKFLLKDIFKSGWENRTEFNDVLSLETEIFTGQANPNVASASHINFIAKDPKNPNNSLNPINFFINHKDLSFGFIMYVNICEVNKSQCTNDPAKDINNWQFTWNVKAPANTWLKVGLAWDYNSGEAFYKVINASTGEILHNYGIAGELPNAEFSEISVNTYNQAVSSAAGKTILGNFKVYADDAENLLAVNDITKAKVDLTLFPNPTNDFLNISTKSKVEAVQVYDMSGKSLNSTILDNKVDVRNLSNGAYIIKVKTVDGETTQKFIKN